MQIIINYLIIALAVILATFINEFTKALTSYLLGDKAIKNTGQLTLNPLKYFEPIGFLFMLFFGYGWGKAVQTNNMYYKNRNTGTLITYTVPILANIIFSIIFYNLAFLWSGFFIIAHYNLALAIFNFIPIYPLCGEKILKHFLSPNANMKYVQFENLIRILVILLITIGPLKSILDVILIFFETLIQYIVIIK